MGFAGQQDYWGISDTNFKIESSQSNGQNQNAQVPDENGDIDAEAVFDTYAEVASTFNIVRGTDIDLDGKIKIGQIVSDRVVTGINLPTSNTAFPQLTVTGLPYTGDTSAQGTYSSGVTVSGIKQAQGLGAVSADTGTRLQSASLTLSSQQERPLGDTGVCVATDVYQGRAEVQAEGQGGSGAAGLSADSASWTALPSSGGKSASDYGNTSLTVFKNLAVS